RDVELDTVVLVAPTSTDGRAALGAGASRGSAYAVSVTGGTGARDTLPAEVADRVARPHAAAARRVAAGFGGDSAATARTVAGAAGARNVAAGFGAARAATARNVARVADGVVVGSALVQAVADGRDVGALARERRAGCER